MTELTSSTIQDLENLLIDYVYRDQWKKSWDGSSIPADLTKSYIAHAKGLSNLFTKNRDNINPRYFNKKETRYAYFFYFHISTMMRAYTVIGEMFKRGIWPQKANTFMDLGCGSGGSLWALGMYAKQNNIPINEVYGLDHNLHILKDAKKLWSRFIQKFDIKAPEMTTYKQDLMNIQKLETPHFYHKVDMVFCSNVLNEFSQMSEVSKLTLFKTIALHVLKKDGMLVIIEPALSKTARNLMEMRDLFLENIAAEAPIPCGHESSCPMLKNPKDWCHFEIVWEPPMMRKKIENSMNMNSGVLKYAYLVFKKKSMVAKPQSDRKKFRALSPALKSGNGYCVLLCSEADVLSLYFDKKDKMLKSIQRGNLVELGPVDEFISKGQIYERSIRLTEASNPKIFT